MNIDQGQGTGVIDLAREICPHVAIVEVPFGSQADEHTRFVNRRAEMWTAMRDWIKDSGCLACVDSQALRQELTAPAYSFDSSGRIRLEAKEDIRKRLKHSTDLADALALTFASKLKPALIDPRAKIYERWIRKEEKRNMTLSPELLTGSGADLCHYVYQLCKAMRHRELQQILWDVPLYKRELLLYSLVERSPFVAVGHRHHNPFTIGWTAPTAPGSSTAALHFACAHAAMDALIAIGKDFISQCSEHYSCLVAIIPRHFRGPRRLVHALGFRELTTMPSAAFIEQHNRCADSVFLERRLEKIRQ